MGLLDFVSKTVKNAEESNIKETWQRMGRMDREQLRDIYEAKGPNNFMGILAFLKLDGYIDDKPDDEVLERFGKRDVILMGQGPVFEDIRRALKRLKD